MSDETRTKKSIVNAKVNLIYIFVSVMIAFFSRKIFLEYYGAEFVGLTTTLQTILGFLNLAELGISTAIVVTLYQPLANDDKVGICEIISVLSVIYKYIGFAILCIGVIVSAFLGFFFQNTECPISLVYFAYYTFLSTSLLTYFVNYKQTLLTADQKNYVVVKYAQFFNVLKLLLQMALAYLYSNMYLWVAIEIPFGIIYCYILNVQIRKTYPWLATDTSNIKALFDKYPTVKQYTKQIFKSKISAFVQSQAAPVIVYKFSTLTAVAMYGNYTTIITKLSLFVNAILGSTGASVGNLIADAPKEKILEVYKEMLAIRFFIAGAFLSGLYFLTEPFICNWLGHQYVMDHSILIIIVATAVIVEFSGATYQFLQGYGMFSDVWASYLELALYLVASISLGMTMGIKGVLLGQFVSAVVIQVIWKPIFLFWKGFMINQMIYWRLFLKHMMIMFSSFATSYLVLGACPVDPTRGFISWIIYAVITVISFIVTEVTLLYIFDKGARDCAARIISFVKHQ